MLDLTGHDGFFHPFAFEEADHLSQLANADPLHPFSQALDFPIGFFMNSYNGESGAGTPGAFKHQEGKLALPAIYRG